MVVPYSTLFQLIGFKSVNRSCYKRKIIKAKFSKIRYCQIKRDKSKMDKKLVHYIDPNIIVTDMIIDQVSFLISS